MNDRILSPFRRNDFTWKERKQRQENIGMKSWFKCAMQRLKRRFTLEYDPDFETDLEDVD